MTYRSPLNYTVIINDIISLFDYQSLCQFLHLNQIIANRYLIYLLYEVRNGNRIIAEAPRKQFSFKLLLVSQNLFIFLGKYLKFIYVLILQFV